MARRLAGVPGPPVLVAKRSPVPVQEKTIRLAEGRKIVILDGLFNFSEVAGIFTGVCGLPFRIGNLSETEIQSIPDRRLVCHLNEKALADLDFFSPERMKFFVPHLAGDSSIYSVYVNLGLPWDDCGVHADHFFAKRGKTLLYFVNKDWKQDWGGETIFFDQQGVEIVYSQSYTPGKVLIFDSDIPHVARPQALAGPSYRFTLAVKFQTPEDRSVGPPASGP
jgi:hypothetical protein